MTVLEDWEHGNEPENESYAGFGVSTFSNQTDTVYNGSNSLASASAPESAFAVDTDVTVSQGETFQMVIRNDGVSSPFGSGVGMVFGVQSETDFPNRYEVAIRSYFGSFVLEDGSDGTELASTSFSPSSGTWYIIEVQWGDSGTITARLLDSNENELQSISATDTAYSSGGIGVSADQEQGYYDDYERTSSGGGSAPAAPSNLNATLSD